METRALAEEFAELRRITHASRRRKEEAKQAQARNEKAAAAARTEAGGLLKRASTAQGLVSSPSSARLVASPHSPAASEARRKSVQPGPSPPLSVVSLTNSPFEVQRTTTLPPGDGSDGGGVAGVRTDAFGFSVDTMDGFDNDSADEDGDGERVQQLVVSESGGVAAAEHQPEPMLLPRQSLPAAAARTQQENASTVQTSGIQRGIGGQPMQPVDATSKEFYFLKVKVSKQTTDLRGWKFDVYVSDVTDPRKPAVVFKNVVVDRESHVVFHPPNGTVLNPVGMF